MRQLTRGCTTPFGVKSISRAPLIKHIMTYACMQALVLMQPIPLFAHIALQGQLAVSVTLGMSLSGSVGKCGPADNAL